MVACVGDEMSIWIRWHSKHTGGLVTAEYADREQAAKAMRERGIEEWEVVEEGEIPA